MVWLNVVALLNIRILFLVYNRYKKYSGKPTVQLQNIGKNPTKFYEVLPFERPFFVKN
jgi:hypothetical protein